MWISLLAGLLMAAPAPGGIRVDVGRVNVAALPKLEVSRELPTPAMVRRVEDILARDKCRFPGQTRDRFNIDVPYAVLVHPDGGAGRVVVTDLGCAELEALAGLIVLELARMGEFGATGYSKARWFGGKLNFNLQ